MSALLAVLGLAGGLGLAVTCRPRWYRPASIDRAWLRDDKARLAEVEESISAALNARRAARFQVHEERLNRWLTAHAEIWPHSTLDLGPLQQPQVSISEDGLLVGATLSGGGFGSVLSLRCQVEVDPDQLRIRCDRLRLGALPIPESWAMSWLAKMASAAGTRLEIEGSDTIVIPNDWVWPNGERRCRLSEISFEPGVVTIEARPRTEMLPGR